MFCTNCGAPYRNFAHFCIQCGEPLNEAPIEGKSFHKKWAERVSFLKRDDFLQAFSDLSFHRFITPKIMGTLLGLWFIGALMIAVLVVMVGFQRSTLIGILSLIIGGPLIFLLISLSARILLETILKIFLAADLLPKPREVQKEMTERKDHQELRDDIQWNI